MVFAPFTGLHQNCCGGNQKNTFGQISFGLSGIRHSDLGNHTAPTSSVYHLNKQFLLSTMVLKP